MMEIFSHQRENIDLVKALSDFCMRPTGRELCRSVVYVVFGPSNFYFDELLRTIRNHIPAGASYRQFIHYAQIAAARKFSKIFSKKRFILTWSRSTLFWLEKFQKYHHGTEMNMKIYGTPEPPPYDLSKVRTNIHLLHGTNDWLTPSSVSFESKPFDSLKMFVWFQKKN